MELCLARSSLIGMRKTLRICGAIGVSPGEFEQVLLNDPLDFGFQTESGEERYKSLGVTNDARTLFVVWTLREGRVRAITAYAAGKAYGKLYWEALDRETEK
jgi:uncharacterized DUF497 family protein